MHNADTCPNEQGRARPIEACVAAAAAASAFTHNAVGRITAAAAPCDAGRPQLRQSTRCEDPAQLGAPQKRLWPLSSPQATLNFHPTFWSRFQLSLARPCCCPKSAPPPSHVMSGLPSVAQASRTKISHRGWHRRSPGGRRAWREAALDFHQSVSRGGRRWHARVCQCPRLPPPPRHAMPVVPSVDQASIMMSPHNRGHHRSDGGR